MKTYTLHPIVAKHVAAILAQQGAVKSWGQDEHLHLLAKVAQQCWEDSEEYLGNGKTEFDIFKATISQHGLGGNASQFRQILQHESLALIPPAVEKLSKYV